MKYLLVIVLVGFSFAACSKEDAKIVPKTKAKKAKLQKAAVVAPCDSKEDLLKKLEEKKKADEAKGKGFSLQGGDTGCSIK